MKKYTLLLICIIQMSFWLISSGQEKPFALFTEEDGLANNDVWDLVKDDTGYLWIGTSNGLSKYDGQKFVNFLTQQGMPGKYVWSVEKDDKNRIYAGCYMSGLAVIENDKVISVLHMEPSVKNSIRKLHYSEFFKMMLVGTDYGLYMLTDTTFTLLSYPNGPDQKSSILSILEYKGTIYFTVHNDVEKGGFYRLEFNRQDPEKSKVTKILNGQGFGSTQIDGRIYAAVFNVVYEYIPETKEVREILRTELQFSAWALAPIAPNILGLGGFGENLFQGGLRFFNISEKKMIPEYYNIHSPSVSNIKFDDNLNGPWICSRAGLICLTSSPFTKWEINDRSGIKDIACIKNTLFALTEDNIWSIDNGKISLFKSMSELEKVITPRIKTYFLHKNIKVGRIGLNSLQRNIMANKTIVPLHFLNDNQRDYLITSMGTLTFPELKGYWPIINGHFFTLENDSGKVYWVPKYDKLRCFPSISKSPVDPYFINNQKINIKDIIKIISTRQVIFFVTKFDGLIALRGKDACVLNSRNSALDNNLSDIDLDKDGYIWASSNEGNLYCVSYDGSLQLKRQYNSGNSEIKGTNYKWLKFNKNWLFISTNKGLNKISTTQLKSDRIDTVYFYNKYTGYENISAMTPELGSNGNIYVQTSDQIIEISNLTNSTVKYPIIFQDIKLDGKTISHVALNNKRLSAKTGTINIKFAIIKLPYANNVEYRYLINDKWETGNSIVLQSLKPGKYHILCEAKDAETSQRSLKEINFVINKPFWQSLWFILGFILFLIPVIYGIIFSRFRTEKRKQEEKTRLTKEIADLRIQSLQAQMNPHFVFNSLNSVQSFILSNKPEEAANFLSILGNIIRLNLENISEEYITLAKEMEFISKYLDIEKLRFKEILNTEIRHEIPDIGKVFLPPMLVQPIIENSIKHGIRLIKHNGLITVDFRLNNGILVVTVTDNGIGRVQSAKDKRPYYKSLGLTLISDRLDRLNQKNTTDQFRIHITDLSDNDSPSGTEVKLFIPQNMNLK